MIVYRCCTPRLEIDKDNFSSTLGKGCQTLGRWRDYDMSLVPSFRDSIIQWMIWLLAQTELCFLRRVSDFVDWPTCCVTITQLLEVENSYSNSTSFHVPLDGNLSLRRQNFNKHLKNDTSLSQTSKVVRTFFRGLLSGSTLLRDKTHND